jgi:hypothetical protein
MLQTQNVADYNFNNVLHLYTLNVLDSSALLCYVLVQLDLEKRPTLSARFRTRKHFTLVSQGPAKLFINRQKVAILS